MTDLASSMSASTPYGLSQTDKSRRLFERLEALTSHHYASCSKYTGIIDRLFPLWRVAKTLEELPWLPVGLFKRQRMLSVPESSVFRELLSSGTSGSTPSRIFLDRDTAQAQTRTLSAIVAETLGRERRPMLIVDRCDLFRAGAPLTASGAAVLGFSTFGRQHTYALTPDLELDWPTVEAFVNEHADRGVLLFGFTFMIWQKLIEAMVARGSHIKFPKGSVLLHGGGWKKLSDRKIDSATFKSRVDAVLGIERVHDYYGMAEQVGTIFVECELGRLHVPTSAEVIVRDFADLHPLPAGERGLIQVLSGLPGSYPGHSILTEDIGVLLGEDDCGCGRLGRTFRVEGRLETAEVRGCSDVRAD